jgi:hypothetical protein
MTQDLLMPAHVHTLVLDEPLQVAGAPLQYDRLPWFDGKRDHNGSVPYLAQAVADAPFAPHPLWLDKGVHLHWTLPDGLKRGSTRSDALRWIQVGELYLPPAPNRWLVLRLPEEEDTPEARQAAKERGEEGVERAWLVESDHVHPGPSRPRDPAIAYPCAPRGYGPPWLYLGRKSRLDPRTLERLDPGTPTNEAANLERLGAPLTALGPGDPTFAASYPSCHSVFGLHDDKPAQSRVRYVVYGWYSAAVGDPVVARIKALLEDPEEIAERLREAGKVENHAEEARVQAGKVHKDDREAATRQLLSRVLGVSYFGNEAHRLSGVVVQGQVKLHAKTSQADFSHAPLPVGLGSSAAEALVALKARTHDMPGELEDRMVQGLAATDLRAHPLDLPAKLAEARHSEQFGATRGNAVWVLRQGTDASESTVAKTVDKAAADALAELNRLQRDYDRAIKRIDGLRQELFNDWTQYMRALYPEIDTQDFVVDPGRLRDLIEVTRLRPLEAARARAGELFVGETAEGDVLVSDQPDPAEAGRDATLAAGIVRAHRRLLAVLHPGSGETARYHAALAPGPQFWAPNDPVLVLEDKRVRTRDFHGSTGKHVRAGEGERMLAETYLYARDTGWQNDSAAFGATPRAPVGLLQSTLHALTAASDHAWVVTHDPAGWDPLTLEWEAELRPLAKGNNLDSREYAVDFLTAAHRLPQGAADIAHRASRPAVSRTFSYLAGRSILNPAAGKLMAGRMEKLPGSLRAQFEDLAGTPMVLPLGGFHDLLLMRDHARQLPVADPIGLPVSRDVAERVGAALGRFHPANPRPDALFHPVRSGELHIQRLRVTDVFGRGHDWKPDVIRTTRRMRPAGDASNKAQLPLRLAQAARLDLRWLRAGAEAEEASVHPASSPVMGWLLPNALDGAIDVYAGDGRLLGAVGDDATWRPAAGDAAAPRSLREIPDAGLARVVAWLTRGGPDLPARLIDTLETAMEQIDPAESARKRSVAALVGQPLALVRARLRLELAHHMALDQSLDGLRARLAGGNADTHRVGDLKVPVRLGEHSQLNDGLCGYWIESGGAFEGDAFHVVQGVRTEAPHARLSHMDDDADHPVVLTPEGPAVDVTLLMEPHGSLHATTGLLPTKTIRLLPEHYHDAMDALRIPLSTGPVLTPRDAIELPLPDAPGFGLCWLERDARGWREVPHHPTIARADFRAGFGARSDALWDALMAEGWLIDGEAPETARVMTAPDEASDDRFDALGLDVARIEQGLHELADAVDPVEVHARYRPRPIARDGWIVMRPDPEHGRDIDPAPPAITEIDREETS